MSLNWKPSISVYGDNIGGCIRDALQKLLPDEPRCAEIPNWIRFEDINSLCDELGVKLLVGEISVTPELPCIIVYESRPGIGHAEYVEDMNMVFSWQQPVSGIIIK